MFKELAKKLIQNSRKNDYKIVSAESCTGGKLAAEITSISGASEAFERGFITYSNQAKIDLLGVDPNTLTKYGAVSKETAAEMVSGALKNSKANIAIAITGIAGPKSDESSKPVGLIYIATQKKGEEIAVNTLDLKGSRTQIQKQTVELALKQLLNITVETRTKGF